MKFRAFVRVLTEHGFVEDRVSGDHHQYKGTAGGSVRLVTIAFSQMGDDITKRNLASMIRQSGLSKKLFRN